MVKRRSKARGTKRPSAENLGELVAFLKRLFAKDPVAAPPPAAQSAAGVRAATSYDKNVVEFQRGLEKLLAGGRGRAKGAVHFIGIGGVLDHYGAEWPQKSAKVHQVVRDCLQGRLTSADLFTPFNDEGYVIVFANLRDDAAQLKCGLIAQEISKRLFGTSAPDKIDMMSVDVAAEGDVSVTPFSVEQVADRVRHQAASTSLVAEATESVDAPSTPSPEPANESGPRGPRAGEYQFVYRPMWQVRRKVVSAYICVPARVGADGLVRIGGAAMPLGHASPENAVLDVLTLQRVLRDYERLLAEGKNSILVVPVHYITLSDGRLLAPYAALCNRIPPDARGLLIFELIGMPGNLPTSTLVNALTRLGPFSRGVLVRRRFDSGDHAKLKTLGVYGVGVEIGNVDMPEAEILPAMERFNSGARARGLITYIHGLRTLSLISAAAGAGFKFLDGDSIMSILDMPESMSPFDLESLYAPLLVANE